GPRVLAVLEHVTVAGEARVPFLHQLRAERLEHDEPPGRRDGLTGGVARCQRFEERHRQHGAARALQEQPSRRLHGNPGRVPKPSRAGLGQAKLVLVHAKPLHGAPTLCWRKPAALAMPRNAAASASPDARPSRIVWYAQASALLAV